MAKVWVAFLSFSFLKASFCLSFSTSCRKKLPMNYIYIWHDSIVFLLSLKKNTNKIPYIIPKTIAKVWVAFFSLLEASFCLFRCFSSFRAFFAALSISICWFWLFWFRFLDLVVKEISPKILFLLASRSLSLSRSILSAGLSYLLWEELGELETCCEKRRRMRMRKIEFFGQNQVSKFFINVLSVNCNFHHDFIIVKMCGRFLS